MLKNLSFCTVENIFLTYYLGFIMNFAYLLKKHKFLSIEEQKAILSDYALKNQLLSLEFRTSKIEKDLSLGKLSENDIITMADIFLLGLNFQDIMQMLGLICSKGIELHIVSENLFFNKTQSSCYIFNACLKIYKTLLSVKNKSIQDKLLKDGRQRGRPKGKTPLDDKIELIQSMINQNVKLKEIAQRLNVKRSTLIAFTIRRNIEKNS